MPGKPYVPEYSPVQPPANPRRRLAMLIGGLVLVLACLGVVLGYNAVRGRWAGLPAETSTATTLAAALPPTGIPAAAVPATPLPSSTPSPSPSPTVAPTHTATTEPTATLSPECEQGYLFVAGRVFTIDLLATMADGSLRLPQAGPPDAAYYVEERGPGYAFFLLNVPENEALLGSPAGGPVSILWRGCQLEESTLLGVQRTGTDEPPAYDPALPGVTIFITESGPDAPALPLPPTATRLPSTNTPEVQATATVQATNTPAPTIPPPQGAIEAEIGFLGKQVTSSTITLTISVYNYGPNTFALNNTDVLLLPPGGSPVRLDTSSPALPYQFPTGASQSFNFNFNNPGGSGIVFQIFNVEFDLDDF